MIAFFLCIIPYTRLKNEESGADPLHFSGKKRYGHHSFLPSLFALFFPILIPSLKIYFLFPRFSHMFSTLHTDLYTLKRR